MKSRFTPLLAGLVLAISSLTVQAAEVQVAVAANFTAPMQKIAAEFEKDTGHQAPWFLSGSTANSTRRSKTARRLRSFLPPMTKHRPSWKPKACVVQGSRFTYAIGKLVLWSAKPGFVDDQGEVLKKGAVQTSRHRLIPKLRPMARRRWRP